MLRCLALLVALAHVCPAHDEYHRAFAGGLAPGRQLPAAELSAAYWAAEAAGGVRRRELRRQQTAALWSRRARNVVMFLGDGLSGATLSAARALLGQRRGRAGEESQLAFDDFPTVGLAKTYCVDAQVADSACSATSYLCGSKANYGTIGVTSAVHRTNCSAAISDVTHLQSIATWALAAGKDTGFVTTTRVTHASPAGTYAHTAERDWESDADVALDCGPEDERQRDIAHQLVHSYPGNHFKVILGGGRREFIPQTDIDEEGTRGKRLDGRNLIEDWKNDKKARNVSYNYVWNRQQLMQLSLSPPEYLLGLFEGSHMQYHLEADEITEPSLADLTEMAIRSLNRNENGFFLFVEGGRIDHAHHDNRPVLALDETLELSSAVERAASLLPDDDTLLVVTADHAHVMTFNGYTRRGGDILGPSDDCGDDGVPYMTLSYANGPGARTHRGGVRPNILDDEDYGQLRWMSHAEVLLELETHGGDDVAVFARGPHHDMFSGLYEQSQLPHLMAYAACIGPGRHACDTQ